MTNLAECKIYWQNPQTAPCELQWFEIKYSTFFRGGAARLNFSFLPEDVFGKIPELAVGQMIFFAVGGKVIFKGRIFSVAFQGGVYQVLCYDQLRYLLNKDSLIFYRQRPDEIIKKIASVNGLNLGKIAQVPYTIPLLAFEGQTYFDMIGQALKAGFAALGKRYLFYDRGGNLTLVPISDTVLDLVIDGDGLLGDYAVAASVDKGVYNEVKLAQFPIEKGCARSFVAKDGAKVKAWGKLRYFKKVGAKLNSAQVQAEAEVLLRQNLKPKESLSLIAMGDIRCIAGFRPYIKLPKARGEGHYLLETAVHSFSGKSGHIMNLVCVK